MRVRHLQSHLAEQGLIHTRKLEDVRGHRLGIDAVYWLRSIQALKDPFADALGGIPPGIFGCVDRELESFRKASITPVFVFQGMSPGANHSMFVSRMDQQVEMAWSHLAHGRRCEAQKCFAISTSRINGDFVFFIFHHLRLRGCEVVQAPYFAGAQLAHFAEHGVVHSVFGPPGLLLFSLPRVIIQVDFSKGAFDWVELESMLTKWQITQDQFVDACMLAGTEYCLTYPYLNLGQKPGQPALTGSQFNFHAAVHIVRQAPLPEWMTAFPKEDLMRDYLDGYCTCKVLVRSSPVLHAVDNTVRPLGPSVPGGSSNTRVPCDYSSIMGEQLPGGLYYLMLNGVLSHKLPQALAKGEWLDRSQPLVDTKEFRELIGDLRDYRQQALSILARQLHSNFAKKTIVCKAFWEMAPPAKSGGPARARGGSNAGQPVRAIQLSRRWKKGLRWKVDAEAVLHEKARQGVSKVDFKFCLEWHAHQFNTEGQLYKDLKKYGESSLPSDLDSLLCLVNFMLLEQLELIADDGDSTVLGNVLKDVPRHLTEPCLVALEMMKFGILTGEPFEAACPDRPFPQQVGYPRQPVDPLVKSHLLLGRVMSLLPMRLRRNEMWNADVDFDLAAFHSLVRALKRTLRQLTEASLASFLLRDLERVRILPRGFMAAEGPEGSGESGGGAFLPSFMPPRACMGIVVLFFIRYTGTDIHQFEQELHQQFPCCVQPVEDLRQAMLFWEEIARCVERIAETLEGVSDLAEDMRSASEVLHAKQQQFGFFFNGGAAPCAGGAGPNQRQPPQHQQPQPHGVMHAPNRLQQAPPQMQPPPQQVQPQQLPMHQQHQHMMQHQQPPMQRDQAHHGGRGGGGSAFVGGGNCGGHEQQHAYMQPPQGTEGHYP